MKNTSPLTISIINLIHLDLARTFFCQTVTDSVIRNLII